MSKEKIPVYDICSLAKDRQGQQELLVERFADYLQRHSPHLHHPHRHSFFHLLLFTKGAGTHSIDFDQFKVKPFEIYFMVPGQVHSWQFTGETDGYIINFSEHFFRSFLLAPDYLERFGFFSGISTEAVCYLPATIQQKTVRLFEDILLQVSSRNENRYDIVRLLLLQLFHLVNDECSNHPQKIVPQQKQLLLKNFPV